MRAKKVTVHKVRGDVGGFVRWTECGLAVSEVSLPPLWYRAKHHTNRWKRTTCGCCWRTRRGVAAAKRLRT